MEAGMQEAGATSARLVPWFVHSVCGLFPLQVRERERRDEIRMAGMVQHCAKAVTSLQMCRRVKTFFTAFA